MSTENVASHSDLQGIIDQRLDQLDRALLGLLPRSERLAIMAQVELQVRNQGDGNPRLSMEPATTPVLTTTEERATTRGKRSRMALTAGVLGIVAIVLMLASPVGFVLLSVVSDAFDETFAMMLFVGGIALLATTGALAVTLGITALVRLARSQSPRLGHGWAITGLCTGPLPMLFGGVGLLMLGSQVTGYVSSQPASYVSPPSSVTVSSSPYASPSGGDCNGNCYVATPPLPPALPPGNWQSSEPYASTPMPTPPTAPTPSPTAEAVPPVKQTAASVETTPETANLSPPSIETTLINVKPAEPVETAEKSGDSETKPR